MKTRIALACAILFAPACTCGGESSDSAHCLRPAVVVSVEYPGASPAEVEDGVVLAIEEAVRGAGGDEVWSVAAEGVATITVLPGDDAPEARGRIAGAIDRIESFPADVERPLVMLAEPRAPILVALTGDLPESELRAAADRARDQLEAMVGVASVSILDPGERELRIEVDAERLEAYGLTLADVASAVRDSSMDRPAGSVAGDGRQFLVRTIDPDARSYENVLLPTGADGVPLRLRDVATLRDGYTSPLTTRVDGRPAAVLLVSLRPDAEADAIEKALAKRSAPADPRVRLLGAVDPQDCRVPLVLGAGFPVYEELFAIRIELPPGTDRERVARSVRAIGDAVLESAPESATVVELANVTSGLGVAGGEPAGELLVWIPDTDARRAFGRSLPERPGIITIPYGASRASRLVRLAHPDTEVLHRAAHELAHAIRARSTATPHISTAEDSQLQARITDTGRARGVTAVDIARALESEQVAVVEPNRRVVVAHADARPIQQRVIRTAAGDAIPLSVAAELDHTRAPRRIERWNGRRVTHVAITVANDDASDLDAVLTDLRKSLPERYPNLTVEIPRAD